MATVTHAVTTAATTNATSYASGSFTPVAGDLLIAFVRAGATAAAGTMTDSQGLGFTKVDHAVFATSAHRVYCFVSNAAAAASSMTVTFACTGDAADGAVIFVARVNSMAAFGAAAVRRSAKTENGTAGVAPNATFSAVALSGNPTLGIVGNGANPATLTPPTNWAEGADTGYATPTSGAEYVHRASGFTASTITWGSTSASTWGSLTVELNALSASQVNLVMAPDIISRQQFRPPWSRLFVAAVEAITATATPAAIATAAALPAPTLSTGQQVNPATIATSSAVGSPTVSGSTSAQPAVIATVTSVGAPSLSTGQRATPATAATLAALPAPSVRTGSVVTPAVVATVAVLPAPGVTAGGNATVPPAAVATVSAIPAPSVSTGQRVTAAAVATVSTLPAAVLSTGTLTSPATVFTVAAVAAVTVSTGQRVTAVAVATVVALPAPTVTTGADTVVGPQFYGTVGHTSASTGRSGSAFVGSGSSGRG